MDRISKINTQKPLSESPRQPEMYHSDNYDKETSMEPLNRALESLLSGLDTSGTRVKTQLAVAQTFNKIAGASVTSHTKAVLYKDGTLTVVMDSGIWAQELGFLVDEYRAQLNADLGGDVVTSIRFCTRSMR
jgi:predicted nucleic acid-binding Zn ribbon protein